MQHTPFDTFRPACLQQRAGSDFLRTLNAGDEAPADPVDHTQIHDDPVVVRWALQALGRAGPADPAHPPSCV